MEYILTPGAKLESELLYIPSEKYLFTKNAIKANGLVTYVCHDAKNSSWRCMARITLVDGKLCEYTEKSKKHTGHPNHENIYKKNYVHEKFKQKALEILKVCGWQSEKVSMQPIIQQLKER